MFTITFRDRVRDCILKMAERDSRITSGAVIGSLALNEGDRWSDLDLTFGVAEGLSITDVLEDWTQELVKDFEAIHLFDLPSGASIYRVFLLPGCLQVDLPFTPADKFGASGPKFKLLFGHAVKKDYIQPSSAHLLFGYAVHHAMRARFSIERNRYWQAAYWINSTRDCALSLACRGHGLPPSNGRGYDDLPEDVRSIFASTLVTSLDRDELLRALTSVIDALLHCVDDVKEQSDKIEPCLRELSNSGR